MSKAVFYVEILWQIWPSMDKGRRETCRDVDEKKRLLFQKALP